MVGFTAPVGLGFPGMSEGSCGRPGDGRSIYNVGRRGGWVPPIRKEETELRPRKSVYVSTTASKGQNVGSVCLSCGRSRHSWKNKERGKGGVAGEPWIFPKLSGEWVALPQSKRLGGDLEAGKSLVGE